MRHKEDPSIAAEACVSIYDRALREDEVTQNYAAETVRQLVTDGLLSHWTFDTADTEN